MTQVNFLDSTKLLEVFNQVAALYHHFRWDAPHLLAPRVNYKRGVTADPVDFVADVDRVVKRRLTTEDYQRVLQCTLDELDVNIKLALGRTFFVNRLDPYGDYATLYFRVRQAEVRAAMVEKSVRKEQELADIDLALGDNPEQLFDLHHEQTFITDAEDTSRLFVADSDRTL